MERVLRILLIRHGESESNAGAVTDDATSASLTPLGVRQAHAIAEWLDEAPARIVVSPYRRAQQTAAVTLARHAHVSVETWPVQEFTYLSPAAHAGTSAAMREPAARAYWAAADAHAVTGEGAESFAAFMARVHATRARLEALPEGVVAVFSHKKFLNALRWVWLTGEAAASTSRMVRFREFDHAMPFANGGIGEVRVTAGAAWVGPVVVPTRAEVA